MIDDIYRYLCDIVKNKSLVINKNIYYFEAFNSSTCGFWKKQTKPIDCNYPRYFDYGIHIIEKKSDKIVSCLVFNTRLAPKNSIVIDMISTCKELRRKGLNYKLVEIVIAVAKHFQRVVY